MGRSGVCYETNRNVYYEYAYENIEVPARSMVSVMGLCFWYQRNMLRRSIRIKRCQGDMGGFLVLFRFVVAHGWPGLKYVKAPTKPNANLLSTHVHKCVFLSSFLRVMSDMHTGCPGCLEYTPLPRQAVEICVVVL